MHVAILQFKVPVLIYGAHDSHWSKYCVSNLFTDKFYNIIFPNGVKLSLSLNGSVWYFMSAECKF